MADTDEILSIGIDASDLPPALKILEQISSVLQDIEKKTNPFDKLSVSVSKSNKELEKTSKIFDNIFGKIKLSRLASELWGGVKSGAGLASLTLGGMAAGLVGMAVYGAQGSIAQIEQARRWKVGFGELSALGATGEKMGLSGKLESTIGNLINTLRDPNLSGQFATLGVKNPSDLSKGNPIKALFSVIDAIKSSNFNSPKSPYSLDVISKMAGQVGIDPQVFLMAIEEGSARLQGKYAKDVQRYSGINPAELSKGDDALINFRENMQILTWRLGTLFAPALVGITDVINGLITTYGTDVSKWLKTMITEKNIKAWEKNIAGVIIGLGKLAAKLAEWGGGINKALGPGFDPTGAAWGAGIGAAILGGVGLAIAAFFPGVGALLFQPLTLMGAGLGGYLGGKPSISGPIGGAATGLGQLEGQLLKSLMNGDSAPMAPNSKHSMIIHGGVTIQVANLPTPSEFAQLVSGLRANAVTA